MIIEILTPYRKWAPGAIVDVTTAYGVELLAIGIARRHEDQTRRDYTPKQVEEKEPQKIEVHNYFLTEDTPAPEVAKAKRKNIKHGNGS